MEVGEKRPKKPEKGRDSLLFTHGWAEIWGFFSDSCFPVSGPMVQKPPLISTDKFSQLLLNPKCFPPPPWETVWSTHRNWSACWSYFEMIILFIIPLIVCTCVNKSKMFCIVVSMRSCGQIKSMGSASCVPVCRLPCTISSQFARLHQYTADGIILRQRERRK